MRIKAVKTSFVIGTALVLSGQEVEAPIADALYLISIGAAEEVQGGKGTGNVTIEAKPSEEVKAQVAEAVAKMTTPKRKAKKEE